jgi:hypothetical protein
MRPDQLERRLRERLDALGPAPPAELLHVLMLPGPERSALIAEIRSRPEARAAAELVHVPADIRRIFELTATEHLLPKAVGA